MKYFSAFSGVGGFDLGVPEDWECVGFSEIDKNANKVLRYRFPEVKNYGDIEKIKYEELPDFDCLIGGSPCQDISVAGKRTGLSGIRSRLFFSYVAVLKVKQPEYFLFENVRGMLNSNLGWDFSEVLNQFSQAGYDLWWQVLDATDFGIPQHRERIFIFGTLRGTGSNPRKVFFEKRNYRANIGISRQQGNIITRRYKGAQATGTYIVESEHYAQIENVHFERRQQNRIYGTGGVAPPLHRKTGGEQITKIAIPVSDVAHPTGRQNGRRAKTQDEPSFTLQRMQRQGTFDGRTIRYLTPLECERLMGWPDDFSRYGVDEKGNTVELSDNVRYNLIGNGVVPQIVTNIIKVMFDGI